MNAHSRVRLLTLPLFVFCALAPPERLLAQQATGAPAAVLAAEAIDQLTGPIALYPDALVFHIVAASGNYPALLSFAGWMEQNAALKGSELQDAAQKAAFDAALVALAPFPQVVQMMVQKPDWTKALGQADKNAIFDSIQRLRAQAQVLGNLKTTPQQIVVVTNVVVERTIEQQVVVVTNTIVQIQPANPQVIYVPTYPQTVYVQQAPPPSSANVAGAALVGFTVGVIVGANNSHHYNAYDDYWEHREDYYQERQDNYQQNQDQRQSTAQGNQDQRQSTAQGNQDQRQSTSQANQAERQSAASSAQPQGTANQSQRQPTTAPAQSQKAATQPQSQTAPGSSSRGGGQAASPSSGMSSAGASSYQSGSATRTQSSRGSSSLSSSRGGRSGGGRGR